MNKILKLNSYSLYDELGDRDYMVYEVKYDDGHKEYISRDVFRNLKALEIIKERNIDVCLIKNTKNYDEYCNEFAMKVLTLKDEKFFVKNKGITQEKYDLLKEVLKNE